MDLADRVKNALHAWVLLALATLFPGSSDIDSNIMSGAAILAQAHMANLRNTKRA
jgi:hypothetical protein